VGPSHRAADLSRGEQRRVAIARALLRKPRWLVLDEPDAWLDRDGRAALQRVLREAAGGAAVVLVTHRADLVDWADRVVVLSPAHAVEASGPPRETLAASATGRALLASLADESLRFSAR
jgi:ABC-type protease/lipase transport system fused ATPase/permease subunit